MDLFVNFYFYLFYLYVLYILIICNEIVASFANFANVCKENKLYKDKILLCLSYYFIRLYRL
jgi:hypothetical protein